MYCSLHNFLDVVDRLKTKTRMKSVQFDCLNEIHTKAVIGYWFTSTIQIETQQSTSQTIATKTPH